MTIEMLLADRGYDTDEIINYCKENGIEAGHTAEEESRCPKRN